MTDDKQMDFDKLDREIEELSQKKPEDMTADELREYIFLRKFRWATSDIRSAREWEAEKKAAEEMPK